jgi:hypothetical protein
MLRRDFLQAQTQKLAQVLARIVGLKRDGLTEEAEVILEGVLQEDFGLSRGDLENDSAKEFIGTVRTQGYSAEKADLLAQFLFERASPFLREDPANQRLLEKVLALYDLLETDFHRQSLENLNRRTIIRNFLSSQNQ